MSIPRVRRLGGVAAVVLVIAVAGLAAWGARAWHGSRLPSTYDVMELGVADYGGGAPAPDAAPLAGHSPAGMEGALSVATLKGPRSGKPDFRTTLTARRATVPLPSGKSLDAWTYNGRVPGPELRVRQGDLVEVTLLNADIEEGVSIHWHGVDVPNAEDGVAGVTQNAVLPGQRYTYRFRVEQAGTFWYHSHQASSKQVRRGLYGAFVIVPRRPLPRGARPGGRRPHLLRGPDSGLERGHPPACDPAGTPVRLRLINSDSLSRQFALSGTPFRVLAIDGTDLNEPTPLEGETLELAGGGRYDLFFKMPRGTAQLHWLGTRAALALSPDGKGLVPKPAAATEFDPTRYGSPRERPFDLTSDFNRSFVVDIDKRFGFLDGRFGCHWTVNGKLLPRLPAQVVSEGDLVKITFVNRTDEDHPCICTGTTCSS